MDYWLLFRILVMYSWLEVPLGHIIMTLLPAGSAQEYSFPGWIKGLEYSILIWSFWGLPTELNEKEMWWFPTELIEKGILWIPAQLIEEAVLWVPMEFIKKAIFFVLIPFLMSCKSWFCLFFHFPALLDLPVFLRNGSRLFTQESSRWSVLKFFQETLVLHVYKLWRAYC